MWRRRSWCSGSIQECYFYSRMICCTYSIGELLGVMRIGRAGWLSSKREMWLDECWAAIQKNRSRKRIRKKTDDVSRSKVFPGSAFLSLLIPHPLYIAAADVFCAPLVVVVPVCVCVCTHPCVFAASHWIRLDGHVRSCIYVSTTV